jgi:pSer/pThr/pTyr-binding forkhead associated (FHA) protein
MDKETGENSQSAPASTAYLIVIRQVFALDKSQIKIGRGLGNDLIIDDPAVSRAHIQISGAEGAFEIEDLDSTSGTFVNRQKISKGRLKSGDIVSLAGVSILFVEESPRPLDTSRLRLLHKDR